MDNILIVGIETVAGANLAAYLSDACDVHGVSLGEEVHVSGCQTHSGDEPASLAGELSPTQIILCGPAARSAWQADTASRLNSQAVEQAAEWAAVAAQYSAGFTLVSSDAVFTGPWMFHDEESLGLCESDEAHTIRDIEQAARDHHPEPLIVRTHIFGWAPAGSTDGWVEECLADIETPPSRRYDCLSHATPLVATDLAEILYRAWEEGLTGTYHVGGAERINLLQFVQRLANEFDLPWLAVRDRESLTEPRTGFGAGEMSLQTKSIRKVLCVAMPMLSEGLHRLRQQELDGHREQLGLAETLPRVKVA